MIYSAISNKQLEFVCEEDKAYKIIKKLDDMYLKESTALQIVCRNKLEKLNYMLNTLPNQYSYIGELIDTLKEEDRTVSYVKNKIIASTANKGQMYSLQRRPRKEAVSNVAEPDISYENAKMEDKQDKAAQHGEAQHVAAAEARQE